MPFTVQPDPRYAFPSGEHRIALAKMNYAADQKRGLAVMTGPVGIGKTTCANQLQLAWGEDETKTVGFLPSAAVRGEAAFLRLVLEAFGQQPTRNAADNRRFLEMFLLSEFKEGRHCVLLLDEGQDIHPDNIDTIADLTNFQTARTKLITIVMLAQDNFANKLERKDKFRSRIAVVGHLDPLVFEDMVGMIAHRLATAGGGAIEGYFEHNALLEVYNTTRGVPRDICILCDNLFINGFVRDQRIITVDLVERTVAEMSREKKWPVQIGEKPKPVRRTPKPKIETISESPAVQTAKAGDR